MIIPNGFIRTITRTGGGFDDKGRPVAAKTETSGFITANVSESRRTHGPVGEQTVATLSHYVALVAPEDAPALTDRDKVEVYDSRRTLLGTYEVQSAVALDYVDAVRITV